MGFSGVEHYFYGPKLHHYLKELRTSAFDPYKAFSVGETPGIGIQMGRLLTDSYRNELDLIFCFDHLETPGHSRFDEYRYDPAYLKQFYVHHLNADKGHGWNALFYNNHDNPRMVSKIDPEGNDTEILAKLLTILQLTLRGSPFIFQGDEIGACNEAFTSIEELNDVESINLYTELIKTMPPEAAFKKILAGTRDHARSLLRWEKHEEQRNNPNSVFSFYRKLIALRRSSPALIYGKLEFLYPKDKTLFAYTRTLEKEGFLIETNLGTGKRNSHGLPDSALLINNYQDTVKFLRPYEARVYRITVP
jgi:oligo-1,6-glucosidase